MPNYYSAGVAVFGRLFADLFLYMGRAQLKHLSQTGMTLIEVLISIGLMSIVSIVFGQMMVSQQKSLKYIEQKSDIQSTQNTLLGLAKEPTLCLCQFTNQKFNSNIDDGSVSLNLDDVRMGCLDTATPIVKTGGALSSGVIVESVLFDKLTPIDAANKIWKGRWKISFASTNSVIQMKPITLDQIIRINNDNPAQAIVEQCMSVALDASLSCESFGAGWVWDEESAKCIAARAPAEEDCLRLGEGWVYKDGVCSPPMSAAEKTCTSLGTGWVWDKNNSKCIPPKPTLANTNDCVSQYGSGWVWNGSACAPPAKSSAAMVYHKSGGSIGNGAGAQTVYCNSGDTLIGVVTSFCGSGGVGNMEGVYMASPNGATIYCDVDGNASYDGGQLTLACMKN